MLDHDSKSQQEIALGEGLAVGCLAVGIAAFTSRASAVDAAFRQTWRDWSWSPLFPLIQATLSKNDLRQVLSLSSRRRGPIVAEWACGREFKPVLLGDHDVKEAAVLLEEMYEVPLEGWTELAWAFVENFDANLVQRSA